VVVAIDELVERSGDLKRELLDFASGPGLQRELRKQLTSRFGDPVAADEGELDNFFDWFVQQYRRPDGGTVVDSFLDARPDLPDDERDFLRGWREVVEGIFEITGRDGPSLVAVNVVDDLEYRIRANVGPSLFRRMAGGSYLVARVVPVGDQWLLSGVCAPFGGHERERVLRFAAQQALQRPELVFRNPALLARSWEVQQAECDAFVAHFGTDTVVLAWTELEERMTAFYASRRASPGLAEQFVADAASNLKPRTRTVGLIYDEIDGLGVYAEYDLLDAMFADPRLVRERRYRKVLKGFLAAEVSPVPLIRLAERDHDRASQVFAFLTRRPGFSWPDDGEPLLRKHKPAWYGEPPRPRTVVLNDRLAPHLRAS
jgi:hypothetical protein